MASQEHDLLYISRKTLNEEFDTDKYDYQPRRYTTTEQRESISILIRFCYRDKEIPDGLRCTYIVLLEFLFFCLTVMIVTFHYRKTGN